MKVALIVSVVAQVAVSQPFPFLYPQQPFNPCHQIGINYACCQPERRFPNGYVEPGCFVPPAQPTPWGMQIPQEFQGKLEVVCCPPKRQCCIQNTQDMNTPRYTCCAETQKCDLIGTAGVCSTVAVGNGSAPVDGPHLDTYGRCPDDGALALTMGPNPYKCTLDPNFNMGSCPAGSYCVRDNSGVDSSGVCCALSGCQNYTTCPTCVSNPTKYNAPCSWLSQGDLDDPAPRCVSGCANFPDKSCIEPLNTRACPKSTANPNGTIYNTGSCVRRCGMVGTGRSSRINNNGNMYNCTLSNITATNCCGDFPGDYCCGACMGRAPHCSGGQVPGGPLCGVPVRGTPNNFYNTPGAVNQYIPPQVQQQPYQQPYQQWGQPPPPFWGPPPPPQFGWGMPMPPQQWGRPPFNGPMYGGPMYGGPMWRSTGDSEANVDTQMEQPGPKGKQWNAPYVPPPAVDQLPSAWICSCDGGCMALEDCCEDVVSYCYVNGTASLGYGR